jgi:hypothetical protein
MAIDASIPLQVRSPQFEPQSNALARIIGVQGAMRQNELGGLQLAQARQQAADEQQWRGALGNVDPGTPEGLQALMRINPQRAMAIQKAQTEARTAEANLGKTGAETDKIKAEMRRKAVQDNLQALAGVNDPQGAQAWIQRGVSSGLIDFAGAQRALQGVPQDPEQFQQWKRGQMMAGVELAKQFDLANADRSHGLEVGKFGEVVRHNTATEKTAAGQLEVSRGQLGVSQGNLGLSRQRLAHDQSEQAKAGKVEWKQDTNGNWVALPREVVPGQTVTPTTTTVPGKRETQAGQALNIIKEAKGLINKATGSYVGAVVDQAGRVVGMSSNSSEAAAELRALEGALMMAQPRMEGPQSDKDVALYRQMAARIGDPTVPPGEKTAAINRIEALHRQYAGPAAPAKTAPPQSAGFSDAEKERRYQEWKANQK